MGASGWGYRAPYAGSVEATLLAVQEQVLASGDFIWPWDHFDPEDHDEGEIVPRPTSLAALNAAKEIEEFWNEGTHTILDIDQIIAAGEDQVGAIRPLTATELHQVFGTQQPSAADFDRVDDPLADLSTKRWSGRSMVIYKGGAPAEVYFWGFSGD